MSSFFKLPASERKRKRPAVAAAVPNGKGAGPSSDRHAGTRHGKAAKASKPARPPRDESISGSDSELGADGGPAGRRESGVLDGSDDDDDDDDDEEETGAEKRLRLAERYLENVRREADEATGFDAEDIDRDLMAERLLEEDVAEAQGRMCHFVAAEYDYGRAVATHFRFDSDCVTSVAVCPPICLHGLQRHDHYEMGTLSAGAAAAAAIAAAVASALGAYGQRQEESGPPLPHVGDGQ